MIGFQICLIHVFLIHGPILQDTLLVRKWLSFIEGRSIPVHSICSILNPVLCNILPAAHAITRCDSTSSLFGIGKRTVFKVLKDSPENFRDLSILADCDTDTSIDGVRKLVCRLYDQQGKLKEDHVDLSKICPPLQTVTLINLQMPPVNLFVDCTTKKEN